MSHPRYGSHDSGWNCPDDLDVYRDEDRLSAIKDYFEDPE